ncbi:hypothetical protein [Acuticoccus sp.]|uniref:hypothetical protein n=1 Tax=Acuticoccus sp. TaxID=1904378 RepID=UPI003B515EB0
MRHVPCAALCAALLFTTMPAEAQPLGPSGDWERLGQRQVAYDAERDQLGLQGEGEFQSVQFCVDRAPVTVRDMEVHFGDGTTQSVSLRERFAVGTCSRQINLVGLDRYLNRLVMRYETRRDRGPKALVTFYGLPAPQYGTQRPPAQAAPARFEREWSRLGQRQVAYGTEQDQLQLTSDARYNELRFCVGRGGLVVNDMTVVFADGGEQDVRLRRRFGDGSCTRPIALQGRDRPIARLQLTYQTQPDFGPKALVTFEAR